MVTLTQDELKWLGINFPNLIYDKDRGLITGTLEFNLSYQDKPAIHDCYEVLINMSTMKSRTELPKVYNTNGRIEALAKRKKIPAADIHLNADKSLCLILPLKIKKYYPGGFILQKFMQHLVSHLYWVSYYERYDQGPWKGERHDIGAFIDFLLDYENSEDIYKSCDMQNDLRYIYRQCYHKGIALNKLRNKLKDPKFFKDIKRLAYEQGLIR